MLVYFVVYAVFALCATLELLTKAKSKYLLILCAAIGIVFVGLRSNSDNDFQNYITIFYSYEGVPFSLKTLYSIYLQTGIEPGYAILNMFVLAIGFGYQWVFFIMAFATIFIAAYLFYQISSYPTLSFFLYWGSFFLLPFTQIRFGLAMVVLFLSFFTYEKGKRSIAFLLFVIAVSFHVSSLIGLLFFVFRPIRLNKAMIYIGIFVAAILVVFDLSQYLASLFKILSPAKYQLYASSLDKTNIRVVYIYILLSLPMLLCYKKIKKEDPYAELVLHALLLSLLLSAVVVNFGILYRLSFLFSFVFVFVLTDYVKVIRKPIPIVYLVFFGTIAYGFIKYYSQLKYALPYHNLFF